MSWEALKPTIVRKIGSGSFGQVFEVYYHSAPMAMKIINIEGDDVTTALPGTLKRFKSAAAPKPVNLESDSRSRDWWLAVFAAK